MQEAIPFEREVPTDKAGEFLAEVRSLGGWSIKSHEKTKEAVTVFKGLVLEEYYDDIPNYDTG